jgi:hypothetical protein
VLECCSGDGGMAEVLNQHGTVKEVIKNDIDENLSSDHHLDARFPAVYSKVKPTWVVSNPPYNSAMEIIKEAYERSEQGCAFLLRLSFLEPTNDRGQWLKDHPPTSVIVLPRTSFTGDRKTDSVTVLWGIWDKVKDRVPSPPFNFVTRDDVGGMKRDG